MLRFIPGVALAPDKSQPTDYLAFGLQYPSIEYFSLAQTLLVVVAYPFPALFLPKMSSQTV